MLAVLYMASISLPAVFAGAENVYAEKSVHVVGDVVKFFGGGLNPDMDYSIEILHNGVILYTLTFNSTSDGSLPADVNWDSSSGDPGTYLVRLLDSMGNVVAESIFGLVEVSGSKFMPRDSVTVAGGGATPNSTVNILITGESGVIFNVSVTADENGEFNTTIKLPFNITTGNYSIGIQVLAPSEVYEVIFPIFINATAGNMMNVTSAELRDILASISGLNTTIRQSLLAKLQNALKKLEQAEWHLLNNQTHVAKNMLNAAGNILHALLNEVRAQSGKHLDNQTAAYMNSSVQGLINKLEVMKSKLNSPPKNNHKNAQGESMGGKHLKWSFKDHGGHGWIKGKNKGNHVDREGHRGHKGKNNQ